MRLIQLQESKNKDGKWCTPRTIRTLLVQHALNKHHEILRITAKYNFVLRFWTVTFLCSNSMSTFLIVISTSSKQPNLHCSSSPNFSQSKSTASEVICSATTFHVNIFHSKVHNLEINFPWICVYVYQPQITIYHYQSLSLNLCYMYMMARL